MCVPKVRSWESNKGTTSSRALSFGSLGFLLILLAIVCKEVRKAGQRPQWTTSLTEVAASPYHEGNE